MSAGPPSDRTVEVCREFTRQRCQRSETECRYAHPPAHVEVVNGRVTCCVDSIKGRCQREKCRYFHPPPQIGENVLRGAPPNRGGGMGRPGMGPGGPGPRFNDMGMGPGLGMGDVGGVNPYLANALQGYKSALNAALSAASWMAQSGPGPYDGPPGGRPERSARDGIEVCKEFLRGRCSRQESECRFAHPPDNITVGVENTVTACIDFIKGRCQREPCRYFHPPDHLAARFRSGGAGASAGRKRPFSSSRADENGGGGEFKRPAYEN